MNSPARSSSLSELRAALRELSPYVGRALWFSLACGVLVLAPSWYMLEVYDRVVNSANGTTLAMLTLAVLGAYLLMEVLEWARSDQMHAAACHLDERLTRRVFHAAFESSRKSLPGGGAQAMNDLRTVRDFIHSPVVTAAMDAPLAILFLALIFAISPLLGVVALGVALVQVLIGWLNSRGTREPLLAANRNSYAAQQQADRLQSQATVIDVLGMYGALRTRWFGKQMEATALQAEASKRGGGYQALSKLLQNLVNSALLGLSCWLLLHDALNGGSAMLVIAGILGGRVLAPFIQIVTQWQGVASALESFYRLEALLKAVPSAAPGMPLPVPQGTLAVEKLVASAPGSSAPILKGLAFGLQPGEVAVVMGPSGAGKSSLARLLLGMWPAASGKVRLDGVDVFAWPRAELGPHLGYLPQAVDLVEGTVAENICRFGAVDRAAVEAAARSANLEPLIATLPQGYDTPVGPNGNALSGGQRQRIALARALYGNPALVVLDEPNSSLDDAGDAALVHAILEHKERGCTFVVMSHRANVLAVADKILLLREGQQAGFGPREEVLAALRRANAPDDAAHAPVPAQRNALPLATAKG
ncbi:type I secretion system permease/ATPase [Massilia brevitalea]|uniref:type I secretion system permease/ATPase n=1 Tax=Massilia brevitalea TaxID=442526 RepID=UPI0027390BD0|nr:type I secretion system permease/ATPase [Massilia brevitalea]